MSDGLARFVKGQSLMDLTKDYPRSVHDRMNGIVQLPRTVDKAKAAAKGNLGEYHYDCPMDKALFEFLGIDQAELLNVVRNASNDGEIEAYTKTFTDKKTSEEIEAWNRHWLMHAPEPGSDGEKYFLGLRNEVAPKRTDVTAWADLLDLDEKREVPQRAFA